MRLFEMPYRIVAPKTAIQRKERQGFDAKNAKNSQEMKREAGKRYARKATRRLNSGHRLARDGSPHRRKGGAKRVRTCHGAPFGWWGEASPPSRVPGRQKSCGIFAPTLFCLPPPFSGSSWRMDRAAERPGARLLKKVEFLWAASGGVEGEGGEEGGVGGEGGEGDGFGGGVEIGAVGPEDGDGET